MSKEKILIVEDEAHIAAGIRLNLELKGYEVEIARDGLEGLTKWKSFSPQLIVLDLMMPKLDGFSFLKEIRKIEERLPILILSAKDTSNDKVKCFTHGVDDFLPKPFDLDEFLLRVERLLKRSSWTKDDEEESNLKLTCFQGDEFSFGINRVDFLKARGYHGDKEFELTVQEIKILQLFFANIGRSLQRSELLEFGWGLDGETSTRTIDNFLVRFRKYFEINPKKPQHFLSKRSIGYIFKV
jgi:DNA-binding response OmpR family regulator